MRTFDDIVPPSRRKETDSITRDPINPVSNPVSPRMPVQRSSFPYATLVAALLVIGASVGALYYFSSAKVTVTPNTVSAAVQGSFTANQSTGDLPYEIITANKTATQSIKGSGTKAANSYASGPITIYNTQSKAQKLIANTRFATTDGVVFRIHSTVTVPGGSTAKPGSVVATVYADQTGASFNVPATSFTVPGFAGTPQANQVYARSSSAMTGGASGNVPVVDAALETQTRSALVAALGPDLTASLKSQIPAGYTLLPGAATTTYQALASTPSSTTGMVDVREEGVITAVVFPNAALAKAVALSVSGLAYQGEPISLAPTSSLTLSATDLPSPDAQTFSFTLSGTASLVYTIDPTRIAATVAGKTRSAAQVALTNYPEIKSAILILRPIWRQTFPQDPSSVTVVVANQ